MKNPAWTMLLLIVVKPLICPKTEAIYYNQYSWDKPGWPLIRPKAKTPIIFTNTMTLKSARTDGIPDKNECSTQHSRNDIR